MGTVCGKKEIREAASCRRTVSLRWFPEQPNLEDEIFSKGGRFVTPCILELSFFENFSDLFLDLRLDLILITSLDLKLEHISFHAQVGIDSKPFPCHSIDPPHPSHHFIQAIYSFSNKRDIPII